MNFAFTEEQDAIRESVGRFSVDVLAPGYRKRDQAGVIERSLIRQLGEMGVLGGELPEEFGGSGLDCITSGLIVEEISRGDFNVGYIPLLVSLNGQIIASLASPELAHAWRPDIIAGRKIPCIALTEPHGGSDAANLRLKAERKGDVFVLNGEKTSISMADQADVAVVFARTGTVEQRASGISAFLVPMDLPGITTTRFEDSGQRAIGRAAFQGLTHPLAEFQTYVQAARLQCFHALWLKDNKLPHNAEAGMAPPRS